MMDKWKEEPAGIFLACQSSGRITVGFDRLRMGKDRYQEMTTQVPAEAINWLTFRGMPGVRARKLINDLQYAKPDHSLIYNPSLEIS